MANRTGAGATLAARLRLAREQAGLSQGQVARLLGLHRTSVTETEAGRRRVTAEELAHLARIYGVSVAWLTDTEEIYKQSTAFELAVCLLLRLMLFFFQAEDGIRDHCVTGVQTCALPI